MTKDIELGEMETVTVQPPEQLQKTVSAMYANQIHIALTPWDIQMMFGVLKGVNVGQAVFEPMVNIIMSPAHAKAMSQILRQQVASYEAQFGPIMVNLSKPAEEQSSHAQSVDQQKLTPKRRGKNSEG